MDLAAYVRAGMTPENIESRIAHVFDAVSDKVGFIPRLDVLAERLGKPDAPNSSED